MVTHAALSANALALTKLSHDYRTNTKQRPPVDNLYNPLHMHRYTLSINHADSP
jgi:hypothetical protein